MVGNLNMSKTDNFKHIKSDSDVSERLARMICKTLKEAISIRGSASLMVSGGNSPIPVYKKLSKMDLDWSRVTISLVDDRWVNRESEGSNAASILQALIQNDAVSARFIDLKTDNATPQEGLSAVETALNDMPFPYDMCVMGMGTDGHTASWFPDSIGLKEALDITSRSKVAAINASGCAGAGAFPHRITLTLPAVMSARAIALYIPGPEKLAVFEQSEHASVYTSPVTALRAAGSRLTVFSGNL